MLPSTEPRTLERQNFPAAWQTVIFRNFRMSPNENIAKILKCTPEDVEREALRMGLRAGETDPNWLTRGYITIIRNNWLLLPYDQIQALVGMDDERFDFVVNKEDFLWYKLGLLKPEREPVFYSPLTETEIKETEEIAKVVSKFDVSERKMFDFFTDTADTEPKYVVAQSGGTRIVHGFLTTCGDAFIEDTRGQMPDSLLDAYARQGVNALFVHGVLSTLSPYPFDPELSRDYKVRRDNLRDLIRRAALRGIKIYLYFNEPRALPLDVYERYGDKEIGGGIRGDYISLCLTTEGARNYLYTATKDLFEDVKGIGGIFNISGSENYTHCYSARVSTCPRCKDVPAEEFHAAVNNIMHKAIRDAGSDAEVIAYVWVWHSHLGDEKMENAFKLLHPEIAVMQVSENRKKISKGGIDSEVGEYSISNPGPSDISKFIFNTAAKYGHKVYAKVQVSNTWECACVPYLPVFDLQLEHLKNLHEIGVDNCMLTWTLGGYPSITYDMISDYMSAPDSFDIDAWYNKQFGENGARVHAAIEKFCEGFREYPFSVEVLYNSPKNLGPANLWSFAPNTNPSSMVCYSFEDYNKWKGPYPIDVYLSQFEKMLAAWDEACDMLEAVAGDEKTNELLLFARFATLQIHSDVIHTRYALCKENLPTSRDEMRKIIADEREVTKKLLVLMEKSSLIGFETSNHYFFTERGYIEKLVQLDQLEKELDTL